jgi:4-hydroxy-tetrahydrodipicolinate synthase
VFTGAGVALLTFFDADGRVLVEATAEHAADLAARGARAIVIAGTTGEGPVLDGDERLALLAAIGPLVAVPTLVGTGHREAGVAAELTRAATAAGAAGVLVHPPEDEPPPAFYARIRAAAGDAAVLAYHFPGHYPALPLEVLDGLDVDGIKDSEGHAERLLHESRGGVGAVYTGSAGLLPVAAMYGAAGAILALANLAPELCADAFDGSLDAQRDLLPELLEASAGIGAIKRRLAERTGASAFMR